MSVLVYQRWQPDGKGMAFPPDFELFPTKSPGQKAPGSDVTMGASQGGLLHGGSLRAGPRPGRAGTNSKSSLTGSGDLFAPVIGKVWLA